ncbi:MAG: hybrid sensor histidine kinase/response regulator [Deltaproteobacteria bacterium]|nr:MAG: hybrid sensor histidine kinase/response regulator [Deltaproteobacteria bacterium]
MKNATRSVLLIEDDENVAKVYNRVLGKMEPPVEVYWYERLYSALEQLALRPIDVVLLDLNLPDSEGIDTLDAVRRASPGIPIIVLTGLDDVLLMVQSIEHGADMYLVKSHTPPQILAKAVDTLLHTRQVELQLAQSQRLEAIGQLAAGIAHEINTPAQFVQDNLTFIRDAIGDLKAVLGCYGELKNWAEGVDGSAEILKKVEELEEEADLEYLLEELPRATAQCLDGIGRIAGIVRAMKEFGHPGGGAKKPVDINRGIRNTLTVARNEYKYVADVETRLGEIPPVPGYESELNQVWLNLVVNASHAIGEKYSGTGKKGKITIETRPEGDGVAVEISDDGCGIPKQIQHRIFEPFFTTKEVGKGTGQGLALARSVIVDKHGGTIEVDSRPGEGTTFRVILPLQPAEPEREGES